MKKDKSIDLNSVEDTLYVPLLGRIFTSKKYPEFFYDKKALELEASIPPEKIHPNNSEYTCLASATRYFLLDNEVRAFIKKHPDCNIVNLGAGLETVYYRIGSDIAMFYELDLPEIVDLRNSMLPETDRDRYIKGSFLDLSWTDQIDINLPTLMIASGLFHYFHREEVGSFINDVLKKISNSGIVFDTVDASGMKISNNFVKKTGNKNAEMYFYINSAKDYFNKFAPNAKNVSEYKFYKDTRKLIKGKAPLFIRVIMFFSDMLNRVKLVKCFSNDSV